MVRLMVVTSPRVSFGSDFNLASSSSRKPRNLKHMMITVMVKWKTLKGVVSNHSHKIIPLCHHPCGFNYMPFQLLDHDGGNTYEANSCNWQELDFECGTLLPSLQLYVGSIASSQKSKVGKCSSYTCVSTNLLIGGQFHWTEGWWQWWRWWRRRKKTCQSLSWPLLQLSLEQTLNHGQDCLQSKYCSSNTYNHSHHNNCYHLHSTMTMTTC